jgi:hypothetical protein
MTWRCAAARDLPLNTERSWDGDAARERIFRWAGWPDNPDARRARRAFLVYDDEAPELKGSYKLPFADVIDGRLTAILAGCRAAASRLPQTDGLSDEVRARARAVLDAYFARAEEGRAASPLYSYFPATVSHAPTETLVQLARALAPDPTAFEDREPFFFRAEISNNRLDAYYTRMHESTLRNFARDAEAGVSLQDSHRTTQLGFGRTLTGILEVVPGGIPADPATNTPAQDLLRVLADIYTIPGLQLNDVNTDDLILGLRTGIVKDVSVGFYGGIWRCAVCQRDLFAPDCPHVPGLVYPIIDDWGTQTGEVLATAYIEDAHLAEVSVVYDGATPGATVLKAQRLADAGRVPEALPRQLARACRAAPRGQGIAHARDLAPQTLAPHPARVYIMAPPEPAAGKEHESVDFDFERDVRAVLTARDLPCGEDVPRTIHRLVELIAELRPLADDGRRYRADLIEDAIAQGVRALGDRFPVDTYRTLFAGASLDAIRSARDAWKDLAARELPEGRQTVDAEAPAPPPARGVPDHVFKD